MTTSRSWLVDLIKAIGEKTALVDHLEEKLCSGEEYDTKAIEEIIRQTLGLRRSQMDLLLRNGVKPNPHFWCEFKHAVKSFTEDCESYEARLDDETRENMKKSSNILAGITSLFLGMEFEICSRCLYDMMLMEQLEEA